MTIVPFIRIVQTKFLCIAKQQEIDEQMRFRLAYMRGWALIAVTCSDLETNFQTFQFFPETTFKLVFDILVYWHPSAAILTRIAKLSMPFWNGGNLKRI